MELKEFLEVSILLGYYGNLLSEKQRTYMEEYFEDDFSLLEIVKSHGISRQVVYDNIKRGIKILKIYEEKIGFLKREKEIRNSLKELKVNYSEVRLDSLIASFDI
jgi:uncharacterized protein